MSRMSRIRRVITLVAFILAGSMNSCTWNIKATGGLADVKLPVDLPGQFAIVLSRGFDSPSSERVLWVLRGGKKAVIDVEYPLHVRWISPAELIVDRALRPPVGNAIVRLLTMTRSGEVHSVLGDRTSSSGAAPAPGGALVAVERYDLKGFKGIEIRDLRKGFALEVFHPAGTSGAAGGVVWSPSGSRIAVTMSRPASPATPGRLVSRVGVAVSSEPGFTPLLPDPGAGATEGVESEPAIPCFWATDGIYATSRLGLLRCAPTGAGCEVVYRPGRDRFILAGRLMGEGKAVLVVKDRTVDPLEGRGKELVAVDLATGKGSLLLRTPPGVFISDMDWSPEAPGKD